MTQYVSSFYINILDQVSDRILGLFSIKMKVTMNQDSFNEFMNIANDSLSELLSRIHSNQDVEGRSTTAEQVYALDDAYQRIRNLFGEDADVALDQNLECYGMETVVEMMTNFIQPIAEFQITSFPTFEFVQLSEGRIDDIQSAFLRANVLA
jgi:hypothetical protein